MCNLSRNQSVHYPRPPLRRNPPQNAFILCWWYELLSHVNNILGTINWNHLSQSEHHWTNSQWLYKSIRRIIWPTKMQLALFHSTLQQQNPRWIPILQLASTANVKPISTIHQMQQNQPHRQFGVHLVPSLVQNINYSCLRIGAGIVHLVLCCDVEVRVCWRCVVVSHDAWWYSVMVGCF